MGNKSTKETEAKKGEPAGAAGGAAARSSIERQRDSSADSAAADHAPASAAPQSESESDSSDSVRSVRSVRGEESLPPAKVILSDEIRDLLVAMRRGDEGSPDGLYMKWEQLSEREKSAEGMNLDENVKYRISKGTFPSGNPARTFEQALKRAQDDKYVAKALEGVEEDDVDAFLWNWLASSAIGCGGCPVLFMRTRAGAFALCLTPSPESVTEDSDYDDPVIHAEQMHQDVCDWFLGCEKYDSILDVPPVVPGGAVDLGVDDYPETKLDKYRQEHHSLSREWKPPAMTKSATKK